MFKSQTDFLKMLEMGEHDEIILSCEPIIYKQLHKTKFWNMFPNDREDMLQVGRMAVWTCINKYVAGKTKFSTFAYVVIRNKLYDYTQQHKLFSNRETLTLERDIPFIDKGLDLDYLAVLEYMGKQKHKSILYDYYIENYPQREVAEKHGVKQQWVSYVVTSFKEDIIKDLGGLYND